MLKNESMIILSGLAGSGKTAVGRIVAERLGWKFCSIGEFTRSYAEERLGMDINQFQSHCERTTGLDKEIDLAFGDSLAGVQGVVTDYRLGFHFFLGAFSAWLRVDLDTAVARVRARTTEFPGLVDAEIRQALSARNVSMRLRFKDSYAVDFADEANHSIVIDSPQHSLEDCVRGVLAGHVAWCNQH